MTEIQNSKPVVLPLIADTPKSQNNTNPWRNILVIEYCDL